MSSSRDNTQFYNVVCCWQWHVAQQYTDNVLLRSLSSPMLGKLPTVLVYTHVFYLFVK